MDSEKNTQEPALLEQSNSESKFSRLVVRFRLVEYFVVFIISIISLVFHLASAVNRTIPSVEVRISESQTVFALDPSINLKKHPETVPLYLLIILAYGVPLASHIAFVIASRFCLIRRITHDTRDFILCLFMSGTLANVLTTFVKNITGRFRPCFFDMCGWNKTVDWDGKTNLCTLDMEKEGRKSFPSGHSSAAFAGLFLLSLYLLGRSKLTDAKRVHPISGGKRMLKLYACFIPTLLAFWIAVTRTIDNWHHYADILAGSLIGILSASLSYLYNYGAIFTSDCAGLPLEEYYRRLRQICEEQETQDLVDDEKTIRGSLHYEKVDDSAESIL